MSGDDREDSDENDGDEGDEGEKNMNGGDHNQLGVNEALDVPQNTIVAHHASIKDRMDRLEHLVVQQHHELMTYICWDVLLTC